MVVKKVSSSGSHLMLMVHGLAMVQSSSRVVRVGRAVLLSGCSSRGQMLLVGCSCSGGSCGLAVLVVVRGWNRWQL